ncbi:MAG: hypothetical protein ABIU84_07875 [Thermoanaerobaculia bacterium]
MRFRPLADRDRDWTPIYDGPGLLAGGVEQIRSERGDAGSLRVTHEDGEAFVISSDGRTIRRLARGAEELTDSHITRALGAPLALAFALCDVYLLHASGLAASDGAVLALSTESGGGKSTLAAAAARWPQLGLVRVADDQLPVRLGRTSAALPHFPQLKLQPKEQYPAEGSPAVGLRAFVELEVDAACAAPELHRESPPRALQALVRATVAAKLFDRELLARHFNACAAAALTLPTYRLRYPFDLDRLDEALALLARLPR